MDKNKDYSLFCFISCLIILVVLFLNIKSCKNNNPNNNIKPTAKEYTIIEHHRDTIRDTIRVFSYKYIPIPHYKVDSVLKPIYIDSGRYNKVVIYEDSLRDTNLVIYYKDHIQGLLRKKELSYKLLTPIKILDSTIITNNIQPKYQISIGGIISTKSIIPEFEVSYKRNSYSIGYDIINKTPTIGYKRIIFKK